MKKADYYDIKEDKIARDNLLNKLLEPSIKYVGIAVNAINRKLILMIEQASKQFSKNAAKDIACACDMAKEMVNNTSRIIHRMEKHRFRLDRDMLSASSSSLSVGFRKSLKAVTAEKIMGLFSRGNLF